MYEEDLKRMKEEYIQELLRYYREHGIKNDTIEMLDTMIHSVKNLCKICESCEEEMYSGRSMNMRSYDQGYSGRPYGMNYSGARGRGSNANRDSMGRYSSAGYSGHHDVVEELYGVMDMTQDEGSRREIQNLINKMESRM